MNTNNITTEDGTANFSQDWSLTASTWDAQIVFVNSQGYWAIARGRRGRGRLNQSWNANGLDACSNNLAMLIEILVKL